jgi:hypothetical protein
LSVSYTWSLQTMVTEQRVASTGLE